MRNIAVIRLFCTLLALRTVCAQPVQITDRDRAVVEQRLVDRLVTEVKHITASNHFDYESAASFKALAACKKWSTRKHPYDGGILTFGAWRGGKTKEAARNHALKECNDARDEHSARVRNMSALEYTPECTCQMIFEGSERVIRPPLEAVDIVIDELKSQPQIPTLCDESFKGKSYVVNPTTEGRSITCEAYRSEDLSRMKFVIDHLGTSNPKAPRIFPPPPVIRSSDIEMRRITAPESGNLARTSLTLSPPVGDLVVKTPYSLAGEHYRFKLHRVPAKRQKLVAARLKTLDHSKLFQIFKYEKKTEVDLPYYNPSDSVAKYIRSYDLSDEETLDAIHFSGFPEEGIAGLRGERSKKLWVECFIPVDDNWIPVGAPLRSVIPIALQTTKAIYLFTSEIEKDNRMFDVRTAFEGRVFDLSACRELAECSRAVQTMFARHLEKAFIGLPFLATSVPRRTPHQLRFQRTYAESAVLRGFAGPFYEITTYTFTVWDGPSDHVSYPELYFENRSKKNNYEGPPNQVFLNVDLALQIGVGRHGDYPEPSPQQYASYRSAIDVVIKAAVSETVKLFGGRVEGNVGMIKSVQR